MNLVVASLCPVPKLVLYSTHCASVGQHADGEDAIAQAGGEYFPTAAPAELQAGGARESDHDVTCHEECDIDGDHPVWNQFELQNASVCFLILKRKEHPR